MNKNFQAVTASNNDFHHAIKEGLQVLGISSKQNLRISVENNQIIISSGMSRENNNTTETEKTELYFLKDEYQNNRALVRLTQTAVDFLEWLEDNEFLVSEFEAYKYDEYGDIPTF